MSETSQALIGASTTEYDVQISHSRDEGISPIPVAGPSPQPMRFVRNYAPFEMKSVFWSATRKGAPPILPAWDSFSADPNTVFLGGERTACIPVSAVNGHYFVVAGVYYYALAEVLGLDSDMMLGVQAWEVGIIAPNDNYIPAQNFVKGILCPKPNKMPPFLNGIIIPPQGP
jgi:hypothetical protein